MQNKFLLLKILISRHFFIRSWFFVLFPLFSFNIYCVSNKLKKCGEYSLVCTVYCRRVFDTYTISIVRFCFSFGRMMILSSTEMKSKLLQKFKAIYLQKFFKNTRVIIRVNIRVKSPQLKQKITVLGSMCLPKECLQNLEGIFFYYFLKLRYC